MQRSRGSRRAAWAAVAALLLAAAGARLAAAAPGPRALSCPPSVIEGVTSCSASGSVVAGALRSQATTPSLRHRRSPPPGCRGQLLFLTTLDLLPPTEANVTYEFSVEDSARGPFDVVVVLRATSGDADL